MKACLLLLLTLSVGSLLADPPGATYSPQLRAQLDAALNAQGKDYKPRTRHLRADGRPLYTNRLILEDSPYLLQHAHNPVDWYSWGPAAFARAKRENKPVFLSIGYSTCHWCHVMERESFEDEAVAAYLNSHFIAIKVDRERRPDVDTLYMTAVQIISGGGGWPMSSFLSTDGKTFFGGTYYPRDPFMQLLQRVIEVWQQDQPGLLAQADKISGQVRSYLDRAGVAGELAQAAPGLAVTQLRERHDELQRGAGGGGFGPAPKFPNEPSYLFLIDRARRHADAALVQLIRLDLNAMARGGIYDQVGGGFHRYSTDNDWLVPHFEKMLYNQAQMARVYLQAGILTGAAEFTRVARQTLDYVLRDMQAPGGGFYSATDADSEGREGWFFVWTQEQVRAVLSQPDADLAIDLFNISAPGNFAGSNIPHRSQSLSDHATPGLSDGAFLQRVERIRAQLYSAREQRIHPHRDEKILTSWNAMMIIALAEAAALPGGVKYAEAAQRSGNYLWNNHRTLSAAGDGQWWRASLNGRTSVPAVQEDYAWLADACISLYDLSGDKMWLERARDVLEKMHLLFWDQDRGGYFMGVAEDAATALMGRPKDSDDNAVPAGNAVALHALASLARRWGQKADFLPMEERANALLAAFAATINRSPSAYPYFLLAAAELSAGQSGPLHYAAHGNITVRAQVQDTHLSVAISIRPGWHINAHQPLSGQLIATVLQAAEVDQAVTVAAVSYPPPIRKKLGFQSDELALYEGHISLDATLSPASSPASSPGTAPPPDALLRLELRLQACDVEVCLPPEQVLLQVAVPEVLAQRDLTQTPRDPVRDERAFMLVQGSVTEIQ